MKPAERVLLNGIEGEIPSFSDVLAGSLDGTRSQLHLKAMLARQAFVASPCGNCDDCAEVKVGTIGARSRIGQAAQGVASFATPGDVSIVTSPVRSTGYAAVVPGGGGGGGLRPNAGRVVRGYRCPSGFQYGGRFTNQRYSTCGQQLFDAPEWASGRQVALTSGTVADRAGRGVWALDESMKAAQASTSTPDSLEQVAAQGDAATPEAILRMVQVPAAGETDAKKRDAAIASAVQLLLDGQAGDARMVRRDGVMLRPIVPSSVLRRFSDNPDMEGATLLRVVMDEVNADDLGLLPGTGISSVILLLPNRRVLRISEARELTIGERRKFGRMMNAVVADSEDIEEFVFKFNEFADGADGAFKVSLETALPGKRKPVGTTQKEKMAQVQHSLIARTPDYHNIINYKAAAFRTDITYATMSLELKRARATWDPDIVWPNGRRGAFRCPVGTRYGGQITDRFGRNCGWGVTRRIANAVSDVGQRLEDRDDKRRERRVRRRNLRMQRRLEGAGAAERLIGGAADRLDVTGDQGGGRRRRGRRPRAAGVVERALGRAADALDQTNPEQVRRNRRNRRGMRRMERRARRRPPFNPDIPPERRPSLEPTPDARPPRPPRQPRRPRPNRPPFDPNIPPERRPSLEPTPDRTPPRPRRPRPGGGGRRPRGIDPARPTLEPGQTAEGEGAIDPLRPTIEPDRPRPPRRPRRPRPGGGQRQPAQPRPRPAPRGPDGPIDPDRPTLQPGETDLGEGAIDPRRPTIPPGGRRPRPAPGGQRPAPRPRRPAGAGNQPARPFRPAGGAGARVGFADTEAARTAAERKARENPGKWYRVVKWGDKHWVVEKDEADRLERENVSDVELDNVLFRAGRTIPEGTGGDSGESVQPGMPPAPPSPPDSPTTPSRRWWPRRADRNPRPRAKNRSPKQYKRANPGEDKAKIGFYDKDGNPILERVPKGANGIDTQEKATQHVADGKDLREVPDAFLLKAIKDNAGNGKRFRRTGTTAGVNRGGHFHYTDSVTGAKFGIKFETRSAGGAPGARENFLEAFGHMAVHRLGFENGALRILADDNDLNGQQGPNDKIPFLYEFVPAEGGMRPLGSGGVRPQAFTADEIMRGMLMNYMILNTDRHYNNVGLVEQNGVPHLAYFDYGLGLRSNNNVPADIFDYTRLDRFGYTRALKAKYGIDQGPLSPDKKRELQLAFESAQQAARDAKLDELIDSMEPENWPGVRSGMVGGQGDYRLMKTRYQEFLDMTFADFLRGLGA